MMLGWRGKLSQPSIHLAGSQGGFLWKPVLWRMMRSLSVLFWLLEPHLQEGGVPKITLHACMHACLHGIRVVLQPAARPT